MDGIQQLVTNYWVHGLGAVLAIVFVVALLKKWISVYSGAICAVVFTPPIMLALGWLTPKLYRSFGEVNFEQGLYGGTPMVVVPGVIAIVLGWLLAGDTKAPLSQIVLLQIVGWLWALGLAVFSALEYKASGKLLMWHMVPTLLTLAIAFMIMVSGTRNAYQQSPAERGNK